MPYRTHPERITPIYVTIAALFVCFLMIANLSAGRLVQLGPLVLTGDLFLFPVTYIFGDILTEVYGFAYSRLTIWLGLVANVIMAVYFSLLIRAPFPGDFTAGDAYSTVLGSTPLIVLASMLAYLAGAFTNSITLSLLKRRTRGRWLWMRTIGSTLVGQVADTLTFMLIAFWSLPRELLINMILVQYAFKVSYEILMTPLTYRIINAIKRREQLDTFDEGEKYNPFGFKVDRKQ